MTNQDFASAVVDERDTTRVKEIEDLARSVEIRDQASCDRAAELLQGAVSLEREIREWFELLRAHEAHHRALCDAEARLLEPLLAAVGLLQRRIADWDAEQERI